MQATQVQIFDLIQARKKLASIPHKPVILINSPGTVRTLGALALDKIFQTLSQEFEVVQIIFNVDDDLAALFGAIELGYRDILYTGTCAQAQKLIEELKPLPAL